MREKLAAAFGGLALVCGLIVGVPQTAQAVQSQCSAWHTWQDVADNFKANVCTDFNLQGDGQGFEVGTHFLGAYNTQHCPPPGNSFCVESNRTWIENAQHETVWETGYRSARATDCRSNGACYIFYDHPNLADGTVNVNTNDVYVKWSGWTWPACAGALDAICPHSFVATIHLSR